MSEFSEDLRRLKKTYVSRLRFIQRWIKHDILPERYYHAFIAVLGNHGLDWCDVKEDIVQTWDSARYSIGRMYGLTLAWQDCPIDYFRKKTPDELLVDSLKADDIKKLACLLSKGSAPAETGKALYEALEQNGWISPEKKTEAIKTYINETYVKSDGFVDTASNLFILWEKYRSAADSASSKEDFKAFLKECRKTLSLKLPENT